MNSYPFFLALTASLLVGGWLCYNGYGFFRAWRGASRYRLKSDRIRLELVNDQSVLSAEQSGFVLNIQRWFSELSLEHVFDYRDLDEAVADLISVWRVPDSRLFVSATLMSGQHWQPESVAVYIRNGSPNRITVTTNAAAAYQPQEWAKEFGIRVMHPAWPLPFLIGYAWALGVKAGHSFADSIPPGAHLEELEKIYTEHTRRMIDEGNYVPDGPDRYRASLRWVLRLAASHTPHIAWLISARRAKRWQKELDGVEDLLPTSFYEAKWIIPAVQDRVRTGSTAPLTQP
ncbi:MAG: hypothetical protein NXI14_10560 [bacterium]|nr:hypothetical protein [bacterium]